LERQNRLFKQALLRVRNTLDHLSLLVELKRAPQVVTDLKVVATFCENVVRNPTFEEVAQFADGSRKATTREPAL